MRPSQAVAGIAFLAVVPLAIGLSYIGHQRGFYPSLAVPIAFGVVVSVVVIALFTLLPRLRARLE